MASRRDPAAQSTDRLDSFAALEESPVDSTTTNQALAIGDEPQFQSEMQPCAPTGAGQGPVLPHALKWRGLTH